MTLTIGTIEAEASACRAAWAACPGATHGAHIHHEEACEQLTEPIENRIAYILREKPTHEIALRLRLMRPTTAEAYAKWRADRAPIDAKYEADRAPIYAKYEADRAPIYAKYEADRAPIYAKYESDLAPIYAKYEADLAPIYAKWRADLATIYAKWRADLAPIYAKWRADLAPIHHLVCSIDGCPFDGRTIFPEVGS